MKLYEAHIYMEGRKTPTEDTPLLSSPKEKKKELKTEAKSIVVIGDSTIDNKAWLGRGGIVGNRFKEARGIAPDSREKKIKESQSCCPPELSVLDHLQKELPDYKVHDYTNDGFTTKDVLKGASRNKVFAGALRLSFPDTHFRPLEEAKKDIPQADCIILSVGGNNFREFLLASKSGWYEEKSYITTNFQKVLNEMTEEYIQIIQKIRSQNPTAKIILTTQYYPSAVPWYDYIYPFMKKIGRILNIGCNPNNPMDVIHEIMKRTYTKVLESAKDSNVVVADVTSSLNPFDKNNHAMQIEPSGAGGKKMAQMLQYLVTQPTEAGHIYRFLPQFFTNQSISKYVEKLSFNMWVPKHPHEFTGKACHDPKQAIELLKKDNKNEGEYPFDEKELQSINQNKKLQQSIIVLQQVSPHLVMRANFQKLLHNSHLQDALSAAHGFLNSGRFGFWRTHGRHGRSETRRFINELMTTNDYGKENTTALMKEWIRTSNVNHSSRAFYAHRSGLFQPDEKESKFNYATASIEERRTELTRMRSK